MLFTGWQTKNKITLNQTLIKSFNNRLLLMDAKKYQQSILGLILSVIHAPWLILPCGLKLACRLESDTFVLWREFGRLGCGARRNWDKSEGTSVRWQELCGIWHRPLRLSLSECCVLELTPQLKMHNIPRCSSTGAVVEVAQVSFFGFDWDTSAVSRLK